MMLQYFFAGGEVFFHWQAEYGDPDYQTYWQRVQENPDKFKYTGMKDGLEKMAESPVVLHVTLGILKSFYKQVGIKKLLAIRNSIGETHFSTKP